MAFRARHLCRRLTLQGQRFPLTPWLKKKRQKTEIGASTLGRIAQAIAILFCPVFLLIRSLSTCDAQPALPKQFSGAMRRSEYRDHRSRLLLPCLFTGSGSCRFYACRKTRTR